MDRPYAVIHRMGLNELIHDFWLVGLALQLLLAIVLLSKREWKRLPFFSAFAFWSLIGDTAGYFLLHSLSNRIALVYAYVAYETIAVSLALAVIYEIFSQIFSSHLALRKTARVTFQVVAGLLILLGALVLYAHRPIAQNGLVMAVLVVEEASRIVEVGLIMFLFIFSTAFGLHWRQGVFGIALGLGMAAAVKLAGVTVVPHSYLVAGIVNVAITFTSDLGVLIWMAYLLVPERATHAVELPKTSQLERWNQAIMELINQ